MSQEEIDRRAQVLAEYCFKQADTNGDGVLSPEEYRAAFDSFMGKVGQKPLPDAVVDHFFKAADQNNDGKLNFEEYCAASKPVLMGVAMDDVKWAECCKETGLN